MSEFDSTIPRLIPTGLPGLDALLLGGIAEGNVILVDGPPGAGKTTLALEFLYRGATEQDEPGLAITFELAPRKLMRDAASFGWSFEEIERQGRLKIVYTSPSVLVHELQSPEGSLLSEMRRIGARRLVVDGLTPLRLHTETIAARSYRDTLHLLSEFIQREGVTALLTNERGDGAVGESHERYVCDTIFTLATKRFGRSTRRSIEITKSRGQDFIAGVHSVQLVAGRGVVIYPRAERRPLQPENQPTSTRRVSVGSPGLDRILGDGLLEGSVTLTVGVSGTGKTVLGSMFLTSGVTQAGERGLLVSLDEHPEQLLRDATSLGLPLAECVERGDIAMFYESPLELDLDAHFHQILEAVDRQEARRVVIDSLSAYQVGDAQAFQDFVYALTSELKKRLVVSILNYESPELLGISQISTELKASNIVDNIVLLNYVEISNRLRRAITVPKARGSTPVRSTVEFVIKQGGLDIVPDAGEESVPQLPFSSYYGLLSRAPSRHSPLIDQAIESGASVVELGGRAPTDMGEKH